MADHNHIYERLVMDPGDAVGALAYALYKKSEQEYCKAFQATHGRPPQAEDLEAFHQANQTDSQIAGYLARGHMLAHECLEVSLTDQIAEIETSVRRSELARRFGRVEEKLDAAKSGRQWAKDIGTSILVNVLTVIVVGVIALGSREYSSLTSAIGTRVSAEQK